MIAIKGADLRGNFRQYCDKAAAGETIIVTRKQNKNVVIISQDDYNAMLKAARNADYLAMIDKSINELEKGGFITKSLDELRTYEQ